MDQILIRFVLDDSTKYADKGSDEIWCATCASGLNKRQCTAQLTIFGDGVSRVRPLLLFRGKGLRMSKKEKKQWDKKVAVVVQPNAWCDEDVMKDWINNEWRNPFRNPQIH